MKKSLHEIDKAHFAIEGLPLAEDDKVIGDLEFLYQTYSEDITRWWWSISSVKQCLKIAREQVKELAIRYAQLLNSRNASEIQASKYEEFVKLMGEPAHLARFLRKEFPQAWDEFSVQKMKFSEIAMHILGELKAGRPVH